MKVNKTCYYCCLGCLELSLTIQQQFNPVQCLYHYMFIVFFTGHLAVQTKGVHKARVNSKKGFFFWGGGGG